MGVTGPLSALPAPLPIEQHAPETPICIYRLSHELSYHPDPAYACNLIHSLTHGFDIGYRGPRQACIAPNLVSAAQHSDVIDSMLVKEIGAGRIAGPYTAPPFADLHVSGMGVVPKKSLDPATKKWRLIMHLSAPPGRSVNDGIAADEYSVSYTSIDEAVAMACGMGKGCFFWKLDLQDAFRMCPVRRTDWELLCLFWRDRYFVDKCLPFGLRSSPCLFNKLADALCWILRCRYSVSPVTHYLDDFLGCADSQAAARWQLDTALHVCSWLGMPVNPAKVDGPAQEIVFLGVLIDTVKGELRLPEDKRASLWAVLSVWRGVGQAMSKRQLLSLIGHMSFACKVVPAGRIFLRRLIDLSTTVGSMHSTVRLTSDIVADLQWWRDFLVAWNGTAMWIDSTWLTSPALNLYTDASHTLGFGAYFDGQWLQGQWSTRHQHRDIAWQELFAIVAAAATWASRLRQRRVRFHCDNTAVCAIWQKGSSRNPLLMQLVRQLYFIAAANNFHVSVSHIPGTDNAIADSLSRLQMDRFCRLCPGAEPQPTEVPAVILSL